MKSLAERLEDYKVMKRAVEKGEVENGYRVKYSSVTVSFLFRELSEHIIIEGELSNPLCSNGKAIGILELKDIGKAKQICYNLVLKHLRINSHVYYGELWSQRDFPRKADDGTLTVYRASPEWVFPNKSTKFALIPENARARVNRKRLERGYAPAALSEIQ